MPDTAETPVLFAIARLAGGHSLTGAEAGAAFDQVMNGEASAEDLGRLLLALRTKGVAAAEIAGAAAAMRRAMTTVALDDPGSLVDTCGTGGGVAGTFNISTGAAFIVAGSGVRVAKHGNRSHSSRSGSADVLEALGVRVPTSPERAPAVLAAAGIVFLFAPGFHPAMRHAAPVRRTLGVPTIFNLLGPLSNPAAVQRQVIGVAEHEQGSLVAEALVALGTRHALVVHGGEGMDELSPLGASDVWEVRGSDVRQWTVDPAGLGMARGSLSELAGGDPADNAMRIRAILEGREHGPARDALRLNAAAALYVSGRGWTLAEALDRATAALDAGKGLEALDRLRAATRGTENG